MAHIKHIVFAQVIGSMSICNLSVPILRRHLFSSTSSVWSQSGACHYSSANSFVDACAASSRCGMIILVVLMCSYTHICEISAVISLSLSRHFVINCRNLHDLRLQHCKWLERNHQCRCTQCNILVQGSWRSSNVDKLWAIQGCRHGF